MEMFLGFFKEFPIRLFRALASVLAITVFVPSFTGPDTQVIMTITWIGQGAEVIR